MSFSTAAGNANISQSLATAATRMMTASLTSFTQTPLTDAESRIVDADVAAESAELIRNSILQQVAASVTVQANGQQRIALELLSSLWHELPTSIEYIS